MKAQEKIIAILENNGFTVAKEEGQWSVHQYTPAGEDWWLYFDKLREVVEYADNFSPDEEMEMWCEAKHHGSKRMRDSIPGYSELWKDQLWKREILGKVAEEIEAN